MKKTEPNDPAYPVTTEIQLSENSSTTGPAGGLTKFEYFANSAPAKIPAWFRPDLMREVHFDASDEERDYHDRCITVRYFYWRTYYAE